MLQSGRTRHGALVVLGGGRWARVIVQVLCGVAHPETKLFVVTPRNAKGIRSWVETQGLCSRVNVGTTWPDLAGTQPRCAIVANAVSDHACAIRHALEHDCHVLAEKPVTRSRKKTEELARLAESHGLLLSSAHVFLYASYLDKLAGAVGDEVHGASITVEWVDPVEEARYGERSRYDASVPVIADVFPHVISILERLRAGDEVGVRGLTFERGGARVIVSLSHSDSGTTVTFERNGDCRKRIVTVRNCNRSWVLDFSREPGWLRTPDREESGDDSWQQRPSPMAQMLASFLDAVGGQDPDPRVGMRLAIVASQATDEAMVPYLAERGRYLESQIGSDANETDREHLRYALSEILQERERLPADVLERRLLWLVGLFYGPHPESLQRALTDEPVTETIARLAAEVA
ncbi:MAG: Gfo/Idh/MocA family oxidoreductase [Lentisphaerae bacterium]|nr:Gfo/Idh/MocA family oxidoreductase [Lentisphaerota bacterium]